MINPIVVAALLSLTPYTGGVLSLEDVADIISFTHEVAMDVMRAWKVIGPLVEGDGPQHVDLPFVNAKEKKLLSNIATVSRKYVLYV